MDTAPFLRRGQIPDLTTAEMVEVFVLVLIDHHHHHITTKSTVTRANTTILRSIILTSIGRTNILSTIMTNMETTKRTVTARTHSQIMKESLCLVLRSSTIQLVGGMNHLSSLTLTRTMSKLASTETMSWREVTLPMSSSKKVGKENTGKMKMSIMDPPVLLDLKSSQRHKTVALEADHLMIGDIRALDPINFLTIVGGKARTISIFFLTRDHLLLMGLATRCSMTPETQTGEETDSMRASHLMTSIAEEAMMEEVYLVRRISSNRQSLRIQTTMTSMEDRVLRILLRSKLVLVRSKVPRDMALLQDKAAPLDWGLSFLAPEDFTVEVLVEGIGSIVIFLAGAKEGLPYDLGSKINVIVFALVFPQPLKYMTISISLKKRKASIKREMSSKFDLRTSNYAIKIMQISPGGFFLFY